MKKDISYLKNNIIAHRGYHNEKIPENSMKSFKKAIDNNYIIELDVHILKDKKIVVFHDDNLKRVTGIDKNIKDLTYKEINKLYLNNTKEKIPTLEEVLELVNGKVPIIIELKYDNKVGILEKHLVKILDKYNGKYVIKSFNPLSVLWFRIHKPKIIRGLLSCNFSKEKNNIIKNFILKEMFPILIIITNPDFISYDVSSFPNKIVNRYRRKKIVLSWTIRNKKQLEKAKKYADGYICEKMNEYV